MKRLLTIGHSYVVGLNRGLADAMAREGEGRWHVAVAAPQQYTGDLGRIELQRTSDEACDVIGLPVHFDRSPHLMTYGRLTSLMQRPWDVIHCWEEPYVMSAAQIAGAAPRGAAFVFSTFQNLVKSYPPPFNWIERRVLRRARGWIAFGETIREAQWQRPGYASLPFRVIPPGIDTSTFAPNHESGAAVRRDRGWDDEVPVIGFAGRFVPEKGLDVLFAALRHVGMPWRALFVGGGPDLEKVHAFSAKFPGRVSVARSVAHAEMPAFYNAMDILCAPSRATLRWREQFGRMLVEAMACGVPVVASDSGEIPYVLGGAGVLLPEGDVEAWTATLKRLLNGRDERQALAGRGLRRVRDEFTWRTVARRHLDFFDELVAVV
jgi:glycosyltransferase involved in cell wall biosynthesis